MAEKAAKRGEAKLATFTKKVKSSKNLGACLFEGKDVKQNLSASSMMKVLRDFNVIHSFSKTSLILPGVPTIMLGLLTRSFLLYSFISRPPINS